MRKEALVLMVFHEETCLEWQKVLESSSICELLAIDCLPVLLNSDIHVHVQVS